MRRSMALSPSFLSRRFRDDSDCYSVRNPPQKHLLSSKIRQRHLSSFGNRIVTVTNVNLTKQKGYPNVARDSSGVPCRAAQFKASCSSQFGSVRLRCATAAFDFAEQRCNFHHRFIAALILMGKSKELSRVI